MKAPLQSKMPFPSSKKWDQSQHYNGMSIFNTLAKIMLQSKAQQEKQVTLQVVLLHFKEWTSMENGQVLQLKMLRIQVLLCQIQKVLLFSWWLTMVFQAEVTDQTFFRLVTRFWVLQLDTIKNMVKWFVKILLEVMLHLEMLNHHHNQLISQDHNHLNHLEEEAALVMVKLPSLIQQQMQQQPGAHILMEPGVRAHTTQTF